MTSASTRQSNIYQVRSLQLQICASHRIPHSVSEILDEIVYIKYHTNGLNLCVDILGSWRKCLLSDPLHPPPSFLLSPIQGPNIRTAANSHVVWPGDNPHGLFHLPPSSLFLAPCHPDDPSDPSPCRVYCSAV